MNYLLTHEEEWTVVAKDLLMQLSDSGKNVVALKGDLGVGKTTFVRFLMRHFGIDHFVNSPTYAIVNEYSYEEGLIYHMDLYRLDSIDELMDIGFDDYIFSNHLCLIEWPEVALALLEDNCIFIEIKLTESHERMVTIN